MNQVAKQQGENPKLEAGANKEYMGNRKNTMRPRQQFYDTELEQIRKENVCFRCQASWTPKHRFEFPNQTLRFLTVINGLEIEVLDPMEDEQFQQQDTQQVLHTLTFNLYLGIESPKTTKMCGYINNKEVISCLIVEHLTTFLHQKL